jgi:fermentation-respiration switch protein FrsA (DUF1100 family)
VFNGLLLIGATLLCPALLASCRLEQKLIFYPSAEIIQNPGAVGLEFDNVEFVTSDGLRLHGWFIPRRGAHNTLVWFHGNAGNIGHRVANIRLLHELVNVHIFIFDYRGYGRSEGRPSEQGTYLDAEAAINHLQHRDGVELNQMILFGRSLGAAVATEMATRFTPKALILESPFVSIREMARAIFPYLPGVGLLQSKYDIGEKIRGVRCPVLVLHGERDEVVPLSQGKKVFAAAPEPKRFYEIPGARHNDTYVVGGLAYFRAIEDFIAWAEDRIAKKGDS